MMSRLTALAWLLPLGAACVSCAETADVRALSLRDPLGLIDDAEELRLYLMPGETHVCVPGTGAVAPEVPYAPVGMTPAAVFDTALLALNGRAMQEVSIPPGTYVALVRGRGTDPVSGVRDTFMATGCTEVLELRPGESRGVAITLNPIITPGVCSDGRLSPDEQCTSPGVGDCSLDCQTTPYPINTNLVAGAQERPSIAASGTRRAVVSFVSDRIEVGMRMLEPSGEGVVTPAILSRDETLFTLLQRPVVPFPTLGPSVDLRTAVHTDGRIGVAATTFRTTGNLDLWIGFMSDRLEPEAAFVPVRPSDVEVQETPAVAYTEDGSFVVVFRDGGAPAGLYVRTFAPRATSPTGADATSLVAGGSAPALVSRGADLQLAYEREGRVYTRSLSIGGVAGPEVSVFEGAGTQSQPAIAALTGGGFVVAWTDSQVDGNGSGVRARVFGPDGIGGEAFQVNTEEEGAQSAPSVAAHTDRISIAFASESSVRARIFNAEGEPTLHRGRMPTNRDFELAAGASQVSVAAANVGEDAMWIYVYRTLEDGLGEIRARRIPR